MIRTIFALALALLALAAPARAQDLWTHAASGASLPRAIGEMRLGETRDLSRGGGFDVILQYGDSATPVTVYVYRSAYPNAAMWFERTRLAMNTHVGSGDSAADPRPFTLGDTGAPNGLREEIAVPGGTTAVAIAHRGQWMIKLRMTSTALDRAALVARMDQLIAAFRFTGDLPAAAVPLAVPGLCDGNVRMNGDRIRNVRDAPLAAATVTGIMAYGEARGISGLATEPQQWCRATIEALPAQFGSFYRRRDGNGWVALMGDSGMAIAALPIEVPGRARAALYTSSPAATRVVAAYEGMPAPVEAILAALPVLVGQAPGLAEIGTTRPDSPAAEQPKN
jgi:hypothetical protein